VQEAIVAAGRAASKAHGEYVSRQSGTALEKMAAEGLQVAELPAEEKRKWVETLPNIIEPWLQAGGEDARTVLKAYFAELRARGVEPIRAWDEGL
jgi:C4-dicarboxylate-binding protein DctP